MGIGRSSRLAALMAERGHRKIGEAHIHGRTNDSAQFFHSRLIITKIRSMIHHSAFRLVFNFFKRRIYSIPSISPTSAFHHSALDVPMKKKNSV